MIVTSDRLALSTTRILIVDDRPDAATSLREALIQRGFLEDNVVAVNSLAKAQYKLWHSLASPAERFDVVVTDMLMQDELWAGLRLIDFVDSEIRPYYHRRIEPDGPYPKIWVYSVFGSPYKDEDVRAKLDPYITAQKIEGDISKTRQPDAASHASIVGCIVDYANQHRQGWMSVRARYWIPLRIFSERMSRLSIREPRFVAAVGPAGFLLAWVVMLSVSSITDSVDPSSYGGCRITGLACVFIGYAILLLAFPVGFLLAPRDELDFQDHAKGFRLVRKLYDVGEKKVRDGVIPAVDHAQEVFHTYAHVARHHFLGLLVSYILHIAALIVMGAAFTYVLINTADDPADELAVPGWLFFEVNGPEPDMSTAGRVPDEIRENFRRYGLRLGPAHVVRPLHPPFAYRVEDGQRVFVVHRVPRGLKVYEMPSFLGHLYFSAVTIFTIGFGDIHPMSNLARTGILVQCFTLLIVITFGLSYIINVELNRRDRVERAILSHFQAIQREADAARASAPQGSGNKLQGVGHCEAPVVEGLAAEPSSS